MFVGHGNVIADHPIDAHQTTLLVRQAASQLGRDDFRNMFVLSDGFDFLLLQVAQTDAVFNKST